MSQQCFGYSLNKVYLNNGNANKIVEYRKDMSLWAQVIRQRMAKLEVLLGNIEEVGL